jgi:hypothetical protein
MDDLTLNLAGGTLNALRKDGFPFLNLLSRFFAGETREGEQAVINSLLGNYQTLIVVLGRRFCSLVLIAR